MTSKRLLKDLPFDELTKGTIVSNNFGDSRYGINKGKCFYKEGGDSDNGYLSIDNSVADLIDEISEEDISFEMRWYCFKCKTRFYAWFKDESGRTNFCVGCGNEADNKEYPNETMVQDW